MPETLTATETQEETIAPEEEKTIVPGRREDYMFVAPAHLYWGTRIVPAISDPQSGKILVASVRVDCEETLLHEKWVGFVNLCDIPAVRLGRVIKNPMNGKEEEMTPQLALTLLMRHPDFGKEFFSVLDWGSEMELEEEFNKAIEDKRNARRQIAESRMIAAGKRKFSFVEGQGEGPQDDPVSEEAFAFLDEPSEEEEKKPKTKKEKRATAGS